MSKVIMAVLFTLVLVGCGATLVHPDDVKHSLIMQDVLEQSSALE